METVGQLALKARSLVGCSDPLIVEKWFKLHKGFDRFGMRDLNVNTKDTTPRYLTKFFQAIFLQLTQKSGGCLFLLEMKIDSDFDSVIRNLYSKYHLWEERR